MEWTGMGCDVCGFGSVEDVDRFDPRKPCPDCGEVMIDKRREGILVPTIVANITAPTEDK